jgi:hypothetical protein
VSGKNTAGTFSAVDANAIIDRISDLLYSPEELFQQDARSTGGNVPAASVYGEGG